MTRRRTRWLVTLVGVLAVVGATLRLSAPTTTPPAGPDVTDITDVTSTPTTADASGTPTPTGPETSGPPPTPPPIVEPDAYAAVDAEGSAPVLLVLDVDPTGTDDERAAQVQRALDRVVDALPTGSYANVRRGYTAPVVPLTVDRAGLDALATSSVRSVRASRTHEPAQTTVGPASVDATTYEGAPAAWTAGKRGTGATVAVIDTGVDVGHPFLTATPKTFWEACFASANSGGFISPCPGGVPMTTSSAPVPGSAAPCPVTAAAQCAHGTHVAGIAVGGTGTPGTSVSGIAPDADLVAISVFSYSVSSSGGSGRVIATDGDIIDALQWLYSKRDTFPGLASVNLSLGDRSPRADACDGDSYKFHIDQLAAVGVATVIAAGNDGDDDGVSSPGCVSTAITVGAVDDATGQRTSYSNVGRQVAVMAAGGGLTSSAGICSSVPVGSVRQACPAPAGGTMQFMSGTSMATPAVSGAIALLRADAVPFVEWRARLQRVVSGGDCVRAAAYAIPTLRIDVALGLTARRAAPCAPNAPTASTIDPSSASVSWLAPIAPGTGSLTTSTVTASTGQTCEATAPATTCVVAGLPLSSAITFTVRASSTTGTSGPSVVTAPVATRTLVPITPARIADTRPSSQWGSTVDGLSLGRGPLSGGSTWSVRVLGRGGVPASGVGAVALNVTATRATASSFLTVWPGGRAQPTASNLNFAAGQTVPNLVIVGVGGNGTISVFNKLGATDVIIDVVGWYPTPNGYAAVTPARLLDTRAGQPTVDGAFSGGGALDAGSSLSVTVTGRGGVPVGAGSVVLNVTAVDPTSSGYLTVHPTGSAVPIASNLNFVTGQVVPNAVTAAVGDGGQVDIYNSTGSTDVVVDVLGWLPTDGQFHPIGPARLLDTRPVGPGISTVDGQWLGVGAIGSGATLALPVVGRIGIPSTAYAVVVNVTAVSPSATGFLTVYGSGVARPTASNLNFVAGQVVPNLVVSGLGADGRLAIYNFTGSTDVVVDIVGWFG